MEVRRMLTMVVGLLLQLSKVTPLHSYSSMYPRTPTVAPICATLYPSVRPYTYLYNLVPIYILLPISLK